MTMKLKNKNTRGENEKNTNVFDEPARQPKINHN